VLVTADHGMNNDRSHNGLLAGRTRSAAVRAWRRLQPQCRRGAETDRLCGTVCELLGVPHDKPVCRELLK
jgi:hypothetical protein